MIVEMALNFSVLHISDYKLEVGFVNTDVG